MKMMKIERIGRRERGYLAHREGEHGFANLFGGVQQIERRR
jgi:hypothetical protein